MAAKDTAVVAQGYSYNLDMAAKLITLEERNPFQILPLDNGCLSFVFDDCWRDWDSIASLFEQYNCPLCVSVILDNLGIISSEKDGLGKRMRSYRQPHSQMLFNSFQFYPGASSISKPFIRSLSRPCLSKTCVAARYG